MCMTLYEQLNLLHDEHPNALVQPVPLLHDGGSIDVSNFFCAYKQVHNILWTTQPHTR